MKTDSERIVILPGFALKIVILCLTPSLYYFNNDMQILFLFLFKCLIDFFAKTTEKYIGKTMKLILFDFFPWICSQFFLILKVENHYVNFFVFMSYTNNPFLKFCF